MSVGLHRRRQSGLVSAVAGALLLLVALPVHADPSRRALIVGIDQYEPEPGKAGAAAHGRGEWQNLQGAVADAQSVGSILVARFGFAKDDVRVLTNEKANRKAILEGLNEHLLGSSKRGDVAFFYYAGHGSQVKNSLAKEGDRKDESLVPSDSWRGAPDIRDKELARVYTALLDKGVELVLIMDSCHSGSISRGPAGPAAAGRARQISASNIDARDDYQPPDRRNEHSFLQLSAAQDFQVAWEHRDASGRPRGLFTLALQAALRVADPSEPAKHVFHRLQAMMAVRRSDQDPVMEATGKRGSKPLFGGAARGGPTKTLVGVVGSDAGKITLDAGSALGLTEGTELVQTGLRLRVVSVDGPVRSTAKVVEGDPKRLRSDELLTIDKWAPPGTPALRLWIPQPAGSYEEVLAQADRLRREAKQVGAVWVDDPYSGRATHFLYKDAGVWKLSCPDGTFSLGSDGAGLGESLRRSCGSDVRLYVNLPPSPALAERLKKLQRTARGGQFVEERASAEYHLMGRASDKGVAYAWARPWSSAESESTLPSRTDWIPVLTPGVAAADARRSAEMAAGDLADKAARLARVAAWLGLEGPPGTAASPTVWPSRRGSAVSGRPRSPATGCRARSTRARPTTSRWWRPVRSPAPRSSPATSTCSSSTSTAAARSSSPWRVTATWRTDTQGRATPSPAGSTVSGPSPSPWSARRTGRIPTSCSPRERRSPTSRTCCPGRPCVAVAVRRAAPWIHCPTCCTTSGRPPEEGAPRPRRPGPSDASRSRVGPVRPAPPVPLETEHGKRLRSPVHGAPRQRARVAGGHLGAGRLHRAAR